MPSTTCLRIQAEEKVTLITDRSCLEIAARWRGAGPAGLRVERLCSGRAGDASAGRDAGVVLEDMESSQVSIFAVEVQPNELRSRMQMTDVVNRRGCGTRTW